MSSTVKQDSDSKLVASILGGERDRFEELVYRYQKMVYGIAWSQLGTADLAEEASQQSFVKAYFYLATLRDTAKFRPWLAQIARNVSVSLGRQRLREISNSDRWHLDLITVDKDASVERPNLTEELGKALADLRDIHRQVLTLFYLEGQSVKEVSKTLGLSESSVKTRLNRARKALRRELERRLADALDGLGPSHNLSALVMVGLPAAPPLGASAKLALAGTTTGLIAKLSSTVWLSLIQLIPFWLLLTSFARGQAANYQEDKQHDFRRSIALKHPLNVTMMAVAIFMIVGIATRKWGLQTLFQAIGMFVLYGLWLAIRSLRVNDSAISIANVLVLTLQLLACILIGFFNAHFAVFLIAMTLANLVLYRARSSMPQRMDYSLFLRAATEGLIDTEHSVVQPRPLNQAQLEMYAKFLGGQWLIRDYYFTDDQLHLFLPPVSANALNSTISPKIGSSRVIVSFDGTCAALLAPRDEKMIHSVTRTKIDSERLSVTVKRAVETSLQQFAFGNLESARQTLCRIDDSQVFKSAPSETKALKYVFAFSIGAGVIAVLSFAISWFISL